MKPDYMVFPSNLSTEISRTLGRKEPLHFWVRDKQKRLVVLFILAF